MKRFFLNNTGMLLMMVTLLSFTACGDADTDAQSSASTEHVDTGFVVTNPDSYDSADTAVLIGKDKEAGTLTFRNLTLGRNYTLEYDGTTRLYDKYGESLSLDQIETGSPVDITFLKDKKHLTSMQLAQTAWTNEDVSRYEFNMTRSEVSIGSEVYKLTDNTLYFSEGKQIESMDLNAVDVLTFRGIDTEVLSVVVEEGHGYLRLANDESFVGGWIEIGQTMIQKITEDMLLVVPEGSYSVNISYQGGGGTKNVVIERSRETTLDISDLAVPEPQTGTVIFSITPSDATLYIDGTETDYSLPVTLEYGLHQMIVKADGYDSITQYLRVGQESAGIDVTLEATDADDDDDTDDTTTDVTDASVDGYKVYIEAPTDAEVYVDSTYVGTVPCSFDKESGSHVITLRQTGYTTRSYTVEIDDEEKDISYSFADLEAESDDDDDDLATAEALVEEIVNSILSTDD